jgi:predicted ester cyclase
MFLEENKSLVRRYYEEMWNRWDLSLADELIGEGLAFRGSLGVAVQGRGGFKEYMRAVRRAFPDFYNRIEELVAEGEKVVARLTHGHPPGRVVRYLSDGQAGDLCGGGCLLH